MRRSLAAAFAIGASLATTPSALAQPSAPAPEKPSEADRPPRPPLAPVPRPAAVPWESHVEFGPDLVYIAQPATQDADGKASPVRYAPSFGFGLHANWEIIRYLRFSVYFLDSNHEVKTPEGSLGVSGKVSSEKVHTYVIGTRVAPTLPIHPRFRVWLMGGAGWGRWDFPRMKVAGPGGKYIVYERADSMVQFPLGAGASFDVIPRWLSISLEGSAALVVGQNGSAMSPTRAVDAQGHQVGIGGLPILDASIVGALGVSILL